MVIEIWSWTDLNNIRNNLSGDYKLMRDLLPSDEDYVGIGDDWQPIGETWETKFKGKIDGNYKKIIGLTCFEEEGGLIRFGENWGSDYEYPETFSIKKLALEDCYIESDFSGPFGSFLNLYFYQCYSTGIVKTFVGGGFCGLFQGDMFECYSLCEVIGEENGGLVESGNSLERSYFAGTISEGCPIFIEVNYSYNCYWDKEKSDVENGRDNNGDGGTGLTTLQMKDKDNYINWDFDTIWGINPSINEGYPYLRGFYPAVAEKILKIGEGNLLKIGKGGNLTIK